MALLESLQYMAMEGQQDGFETVIRECLSMQEHMLNDEAPDNEMPSTEPGTLDLTQWSEGTEEYAKLTPSELYKLMGLPDNRIPGFNDLECAEGVHEPWTHHDFFKDAHKEWNEQKALVKEGKTIAADPLQKWRVLQPRWHQLVGMFKMLVNIFDGKPILLMDEVGLGKTMQVVGVIAILDFYRSFYGANKYFPGYFREWNIILITHDLLTNYCRRQDVSRQGRKYPRQANYRGRSRPTTRPVDSRDPQIFETRWLRYFPIHGNI